jgi:hypothetical protein
MQDGDLVVSSQVKVVVATPTHVHLLPPLSTTLNQAALKQVYPSGLCSKPKSNPDWRETSNRPVSRMGGGCNEGLDR